jgi:hypothetical protein
MKLDLSQFLTKDEIAEHFEEFKEAYAYAEYFDEPEEIDEHMTWFEENAPWFFPVIDRWVVNHTRAKS